jgi:hypothetical protein
MNKPLLPPRPLGQRPLTARETSILLHDVYAAIHCWRHACHLCGRLKYDRKTGLCLRCRRVPMDTIQAADALAEWKEAQR